MNTITRKINGIDASISNKAAERLSEYVPRGCPFKDYTLLDLLKDLVRMYGYNLEWYQTMTMTEFIQYYWRFSAGFTAFYIGIFRQ